MGKNENNYMVNSPNSGIEKAEKFFAIRGIPLFGE
jgi:hypothetical protein